MIFLDSSALVKLYVDEPGSDHVEQLLLDAGPGAAVISRLAVVEVAAALTRRSRKGDLSLDDLSAVMGRIRSDAKTRFRVVELGGATMSRAIIVVEQHALRAADAIQLACALLAFGQARQQVGHALVSSDAELNNAAARESILVVDPTNQAD